VVDIFVSHSTSDKGVAEWLVGALETAGVTCWIAPRDIPPGSDFGEEIFTAIEQSTMFVLVFSNRADGSKHVLREVDLALDRDKIIVPIKIDDSVPTGGMGYRLRTVQWIDAGGTPIPAKIVQDTLTVLTAAAKRAAPPETPEFIMLNVCSRCGAQYPEHDPSGCSFHPQTPVRVGNAGPRRDYADLWQFPCCSQRYIGTFRSALGHERPGTYDRNPPSSPGCVQGRHTPRYLFA
jgi:hypothetical protein